MDILAIVQANVLTPIVLFFILGVIAARIKSDLRIPDAISSILPIYLLAAIGLHGGIEMRKTGFESMVIPMIAAIVLSIIMTLYHYQILRKIGKFNIFDSYALASTYGAVGAVTFSVGLSFLRSQSISSEGYLAAILAVLEPISFILSIFLVNSAAVKNIQKKREQLLSEKELQKKSSSTDILKDHPKQEVATEHKKAEHNHTFTTSKEVDELQKSVTTKSNMLEVLHETITGKAIVILLGSIVIGYVIGEHGFESIKIVFDDLFFGALVIFLLEMGVVAGQRLSDIRKVGLFLIIFALVIPTLNGTIGVVTFTYLGLSTGGAVLFGTLMASASFIAAPAIFRTAIPKANPSLYLTSALGITFPYIVIVLLPVLLILSTTLHGGTI
ncbi:MAG: sodium-dependent bicarbonate transport family permease [Nitrososphaeraceae archaeon]|nr:sodium-dependent bicarbonate transport family permease [Nitrososphaeraceae archaeon]